jgi:hypothetical protein
MRLLHILLKCIIFFKIHGFIFFYLLCRFIGFLINSCCHLIRSLRIIRKKYLKDFEFVEFAHRMSLDPNEFFKIIIIFFIGSSIQVDPIVPTNSKGVFTNDKIRGVRISERDQNITFMFLSITVSDRKLFVDQVCFDVYIQTEYK